jgi:hypothetical protein
MMTGDPALFERAWELRSDDFDACVAAHYLARHQPDAESALEWNARALAHAEAAGPERVRGFFPSLLLNLAKAYDGYSAMIRRGISSGRARVAAAGESAG